MKVARQSEHEADLSSLKSGHIARNCASRKRSIDHERDGCTGSEPASLFPARIRSIGQISHRAFTVFNVAQVDDLDVPQDTPEPPAEGAVEAFVAATGADIRHGGDRACYVPSKDFTALPNPSTFRDEQNYRATKLHELCHWTGHEKRLNRNLKNRFGTRAYAAEELVAELGAAFLCAHLGVQGQLRHAGYIDSWLSMLKEDDRAIFTAASRASAAADYLRSFSEDLVEKLTEET